MPGKESTTEEDKDSVESHDSAEPEIQENPQPAWVSLAAAALPVLLLFLGTGEQPWAFGLAAAFIGFVALVFPPKGKVPFAFLGVTCVILFFTVLPMIPLPWPHWPEWRGSLLEDFHLALPSTWSPQPKVTLENWCGLVLMIGWFFWTSTRVWPSDDRIKAMRILAGGVIALSLVAIVFYLLKWKPPGWNSEVKDLGPYSNRNHFSCLMAMASLLCYGVSYEFQRRKSRLWILFALGVLPLLTVTLWNTSRAGLALFFVGTMLWILTASMRSGGSRNRNAARIAVGFAICISILFVFIAGVVLFGRPLAQRFSGDQGIFGSILSDSRMALYAEAAPLAVDQPMMGLGLGNFGAVFNLIHHLPNAYLRYVHPESDWLWFLCEAGWPATFAIAMGVIFIISAMEPWRPSAHKHGRRERRMRRAAGLAFLLSVGHGMIDTPNHILPHFLLLLLLGALSLRPSSLARMKGVAVPGLFRIFGVASLVASACWFATSMGVVTPFGGSVADRYTDQARAEIDAGQPASALAHALIASNAAPVLWEPYFLQGIASLRSGRPESDAMAAFGLSRYLEPHLTQTCMAEASHWLETNPINALPAWREALNRDPAQANFLFRTMLDTVGPNVPMRTALRDLANRPGLLVIFMATGNNQEAKDTLSLLLQQYPSLESLTSPERSFVVNQWWHIGARKALNRFLAALPALEPDTWSIRAQMLAEEGKLEPAFRLLQQYVHPPTSSFSDQTLSINQLEHDFQMYPSDAKRGLLLYAAQRDRSQWDAALATLDRIAALPNRPRQVYFEMAVVHAQKGDFAKAWQLAQQYLSTPE